MATTLPTSWKYKVDLHVHTRRFSPCAETLDPEKLHQAMEQRGLHGVVITEHDRLWPLKDIAVLNRRLKNRRIYRGVEVSSKNGHFIVIGVDLLDGIYPGMGVGELIKAVQAQEAAVIWAHPLLNYTSVPEPLSLEKVPQTLHAVEVASGVTSGDRTVTALAYAQQMHWTAVAGSDAHVLSQVGSTYTRFARLPKDEKALAAAICAGRCRIEVESRKV